MEEPQPFADGDDYARHRQLAVVEVATPISHANPISAFNFNSNSNSSSFSLPDGWAVQKVPRSNGVRSDTYYIELETGLKFRSMREVKRYMNVEEYKPTRSRPLRLEYRIRKLENRELVTTVANKSPASRPHNSTFTLPEDWFVERVRRKSGGIIDKYYHDPATGKRFRSLKEVERYLTGSPPKRSRAKKLHYPQKVTQNYQEKHFPSPVSRKMIISGGEMLEYEEDKYNPYQLTTVSPLSISPNSPFKLPDGWIVEEVPRRSGDHTDKYYYEPGTGQKFRSLISVQKHLAELEENSPLSVVLEELRENNLPLSKAFKLGSPIKNYGSYDSWKKSISRKEPSSFLSPPSKINWVIASSGGDSWNAFIGDTIVPDAVKQQWGQRFMMAIRNSKHDAPISGLVPKPGYMF